MTAAEVLPSVGKYIKHSFTKSYIGSTLHSLYVCGIGMYLYCFFTCSATLAGGTQWLIHYYNCMSPMWLAFF